MKKKQPLELLSPAKNLHAGCAAIDCGADAVYIGATRFSARSQASNSIEDIEKLCRYAHLFKVKVYAAVNTLVYDYEIESLQTLLHDLYDAGVDGYIIQDLAILSIPHPPLPLIASTQMHNHTPQRVKMLEQAGFSRVILARELSLDDIAAIRQSTNIELEVFVHGSLCVCYSGRCYLSLANGGRSANRGECAQPCRLKYTLKDNDGKIIIADKHLLCLKDMNRSEHIAGLIQLGVTSFKIEGRLKDLSYVKNITAYYSGLLNQFISLNTGYCRSSAGSTDISFTPDPAHSFNRGFTGYMIHGRTERISSFNTPKSTGHSLGKVIAVKKNYIITQTALPLANNDGLCYFDEKGELQGFKVNKAEGKKIYPARMPAIQAGTMLYRNHDQKFEQLLESSCCRRIIGVTLTLEETPEGVCLTAEDEDQYQAASFLRIKKIPARKPQKAKLTLENQLSRSGGTIFRIQKITDRCSMPLFLPVSALNGLRRDVLEQLMKQRQTGYQRTERKQEQPVDLSAWLQESDHANISNHEALNFLSRAGIYQTINAPEITGLKPASIVMKTKMCLRYELGFCPVYHKNARGEKAFSTPFHLFHDKQQYIVEFDCSECVMILKTGNRDSPVD